MSGDKFACFVNNEGSFNVHGVIHNFWKKSYEVHVFVVVQACTRSLNKVHEKSWTTRISNSFSSELCVKSVRICSFSGPYFSAFGRNTLYLSVFSPNVEKYGPEKLQIRTFLTQRKTWENLWSSHVFKGYSFGTLAWNGLIKNLEQKQPPELFYKKVALKNSQN